MNPAADPSNGCPWLANEQWAAREIVCPRPVGAFVLVLAYLFFGLPGAAIFVLSAMRGGHFGEWMLSLTLLCLAAGVTFLWRRGNKYGESVCRLMTLPAAIGGCLQADVECALPPDPAVPTTISLVNFGTNGRSEILHWRVDSMVASTQIPVGSGGRAIVPVRLEIPRHPDQVPLSFAKDNFWSRGRVGWRLEIRKKAPGIDFVASFLVPVFDLAAATATEQRQD